MAQLKKSAQRAPRNRPPARTADERENQLISYAVDLAEQQLLEGTASAQVITHFLKLATTREQLERQKLHYETELLKAKKEAVESATRVEELYRQALEAMKSYGGDDSVDEPENPELL